MVIAKHLEEIVQHEERGQIERLDVLELDQQLQKAIRRLRSKRNAQSLRMWGNKTL